MRDAVEQLHTAMLLREQGVIAVFLVCKDQEDCLDILDLRDHLDNEENQVNLEETDSKDQKDLGEFKAYLDIPEHLVYLASLVKLELLDPLVLPDATEQRVNMVQLDQQVFQADLVFLETMV